MVGLMWKEKKDAEELAQDPEQVSNGLTHRKRGEVLDIRTSSPRKTPSDFFTMILHRGTCDVGRRQKRPSSAFGTWW